MTDLSSLMVLFRRKCHYLWGFIASEKPYRHLGLFLGFAREGHFGTAFIQIGNALRLNFLYFVVIQVGNKGGAIEVVYEVLSGLEGARQVQNAVRGAKF